MRIIVAIIFVLLSMTAHSAVVSWRYPGSPELLGIMLVIVILIIGPFAVGFVLFKCGNLLLASLGQPKLALSFFRIFGFGWAVSIFVGYWVHHTGTVNLYFL